MAAAHIAQLLKETLAERRLATLALSGGSTPRVTFEQLARHDVDWDFVHLVQVDERVSSILDGDRNLLMHQHTIAARVELGGMLSMPVGEANLDRAAWAFTEDLVALAGDPVVLDVAQLGLGSDGHTASLVPGDSALGERERSVAIAGPYQGRQRMTLTVPVLRQARSRVWIVTGESKHQALALTLSNDLSVPASLVVGPDDVFFVDRAAVDGPAEAS